MKKLSLFISTFFLGFVVFLALPSVIQTLIAQAVACNDLVSSTCGLNVATCQFEGGTVRSDFTCSSGICCAWPPIITPAPPTLSCSAWGGYCIYSFASKPNCPSGTTEYPNYDTAGGPGDCNPFTTGNPVFSNCCRTSGGGGGGWGNCSTPQGNGVCQDMNTTPCNGLDIANYCPGPVNIRCCVPVPRYTISGTVYVDTNRNGNRDSGEAGYGGLGVSGPASTTTDGNGNYTFSNILGGSYTISISVPANHVATTPNPSSRTVTVGPDQANINFGIVPIYSITGSVFNDVDRDYVRDAGEGKTWPQGTSFSTTGGNLSANSGAGTFSITNLYAGNYTVRLTSAIPTGFLNRHPLNGPPPAFSVTVGSGCTFSPQHPNAAGRATCNGRGDVSNLNFVITNSIPWFQTYGFDVRIDSGITNLIPAAPTYPGFMSVIDTLN